MANTLDAVQQQSKGRETSNRLGNKMRRYVNLMDLYRQGTPDYTGGNYMMQQSNGYGGNGVSIPAITGLLQGLGGTTGNMPSGDTYGGGVLAPGDPSTGPENNPILKEIEMFAKTFTAAGNADEKEKK